MPVRVLTRGRPGRRRGRAEHPHRRIRRRSAPRPSSSPPVRAAGSACPRRATCTAPTRTRPTPATATRWRITRAPNCRGIECFQINPLIKDYNGPACAYVANPFGGYQVNAQGERFVDSDYWSGQMMAEVKNEIESARGPIYLKVSHLPDETLTTLEGILHTTERPTRGTFHANRGHDYRTHDIEMHISEIGLCSGHSASGVWVDEHARTTVPGLYAAGDLACVPHNYMIGAFVYGDLAGAHAARHPGRRRCAATASGRSDRGRARADLPAAAPPGRPAAAAGRVQAAPLRQRLCRAAQDGRQAVASPCRPSTGCATRSPASAPPRRTS